MERLGARSGPSTTMAEWARGDGLFLAFETDDLIFMTGEWYVFLSKTSLTGIIFEFPTGPV
jgi:hypothetical protein